MQLDAYIENALHVEYLLDEIKSGLLRTIVENCFEKLDIALPAQKMAEIILAKLFAKLVSGFNFAEFLEKIPDSERSPFISDLLYHIYYLNLPVEHFVSQERLLFYLVQVMSATASEKTIQNIFANFSFAQKIRLYGFCQTYFDEGSYRLFCATKNQAPQELIKILSLAPKKQVAMWIEREREITQGMLKSALCEVLRVVERKVEVITHALLQHKKTCTPQEVKKFIEIFGLYGHQVPDSAATIRDYDSLDEKLSHLNKGSKPFVDAVYKHVYALSHTPEHYRRGIEMITYALPTRGKDLSQFAWLQSIVEGLAFFSEYFNIPQNIPIIVFDQSNHALFEKNANYIKSLKAPILHFDTQDILKLAASLEIQGLLMTDGCEFGYGGARNAIFLLAPLIKYYYVSKIDFHTLEKNRLRQDFKEVVLEEKRGPVVLHMGDDDVSVPHSTIFSDALFAFDHQNEYFCRYGWLTGRKTTAIDTTFELTTVLTHAHDLVLQHRFQEEPFSHGMATLLTKPKLCLNVPFGAEEVYLLAMKRYFFDFREPAIHLSGYRFPTREIPENRFSGLSELLRSHYRYILGMALVMDLIDPPNRRKRGILPWNQRKKPFKNLLAAIRCIVRKGTIHEMQEGFRRNFKELSDAFHSYQYDPNVQPEFATLGLKGLENLDSAQKQFLNKVNELKQLFEEMSQDFSHFQQFLSGKKQDYGSNFTHSLSLLTNVIENATFQAILSQALSTTNGKKLI